MIKAIITQREEKNQYGGLIDSLEHEYVDFFEALGVAVFPVSSFTKDLEAIVRACKWELIVFSGGGVIPRSAYRYENTGFEQKERDRVEDFLLEYAEKYHIPVVGICRGMQKINAYYGGRTSSFDKAAVPRKIREEHPVKMVENGRIIAVNNYHKDGLFSSDLGAGLQALALDEENGTIEAFTDGNRIVGVQWHPERMDKESDANGVFKNWLEKILSNS